VRWLRGLLLLSIGPLPLCAQSGEAIQQRLHELLARGDYQTELPDVAADRNSGERSNLAGNGAARRHRHGEVGVPIGDAPGQSLRLPGFGGAGEALLWTLVVVLDVLLVVAIRPCHRRTPAANAGRRRADRLADGRAAAAAAEPVARLRAARRCRPARCGGARHVAARIRGAGNARRPAMAPSRHRSRDPRHAAGPRCR